MSYDALLAAACEGLDGSPGDAIAAWAVLRIRTLEAALKRIEDCDFPGSDWSVFAVAEIARSALENRFVEIVATSETEGDPRRCDCWDKVNALIVRGPLQGNGWDKTAERNGLIIAANTIAPFAQKTS